MATRVWVGNARAIADVWTLAVGGTIEATDVFVVTINGKALSVVGGSTAAATVADAIVAAWLALSAADYPEFAEYTPAATSGGSFTATAKTAGIPGAIAASTTETGGGAADSQTFVATHTTTGTGPNDWGNAANWTGAAVPIAADTVVFENSAVPVKYGLDQSAVTLAALQIHSTFTGEIGLPRRNASATGGYQEYRADYLAVGATLVSIGQGNGKGSARIKLDFGAVAASVDVFGSAAGREQGLEAVLLKGTDAGNSLRVTQGSVGVAVFAGETANLSGGLRVGFESSVSTDAVVRCGSGVTLAAIDQTGGKLEINSAATTITRTAGEMAARGTGAITTLNNRGGTFYDETSGTITLVENQGEFDRRRVMASQTITTLRVYPKSKTWIPFGVTVTNPFETIGCTIGEVTIDVGVHRKYTFAAI